MNMGDVCVFTKNPPALKLIVFSIINDMGVHTSLLNLHTAIGEEENDEEKVKSSFSSVLTSAVSNL